MSKPKHTYSTWVKVRRNKRDLLVRVEGSFDIDKILATLAKRAAKTKTGKVSMLRGSIKVGVADVIGGEEGVRGVRG